MPKIQIEVKKVGSDATWTEDYTINHDDPTEWATDIINQFNNSLRSHEHPRELVGVIVLNPNGTPKREHEWEKTNLFTVIRGNRNYDIAACKHCGITGKRFGMSSTVSRDSKYRAKKYEFCTD